MTVTSARNVADRTFVLTVEIGEKELASREPRQIILDLASALMAELEAAKRPGSTLPGQTRAIVMDD